MTSSREEDERVMEILAAARRKPATEREAYLQSACAGDEELRREIVDALRWEERMGGFLQQPVRVIADGNSPPDSATTGAVQFAAGLEIGQYRIESKLGEGGMSTVWLALDTRLGRRVAIKFLSDDLADAEARRRFQREAQMASSLNHPHIVTVYDTGEFEGRHYLVTEYVDGGTLKDWVKEKRRTPKEVAELLTGVADGLAAAHQAGILHRDIKPMNILVARNGYAKRGDFGLAKLAEDGGIDLAARSPDGVTRPGLILGTIAYMSPEQASGQPLDSRSDIFSFGVVLYEMLSGRRPFGGETDLEVLKTIIHGKLPLGEEVPEAYRNVVEKTLEKNPAERYQSMREMVVDLRRAQRSEELSPAPPKSKRVSASPKVWLKIGIGIFAIGVMALAGLVRYRWHRPQSLEEQAALTAVPFTALPARATAPAFSPDGSRIAFAWDGDPRGGGKGFDLYVKAIGSETLLRLTLHPSEDLMSAAWSPDGTQIAFLRLAGADTGIYVVPALGGPERKLHSTRVPLRFYETISWSPDARWIAFSDWLPPDDHTGIYLLSPDTGETERIPNGTKCLEQVQPAFSHRGEYLAYWCSQTGVAVLYSQPVQGGEPKMVSTFRGSPAGLTWSADDRELLYSLWGDRLSRVTVSDGSVRTLAFGPGAVLPTVSPRGDKLGYSAVSYRPSIWRKDLLHPDSPAVAFIPSSQGQFDAQYSPDGNRIAFASMRSGMQGVWIGNEDGSNLVKISNPAQASGSPQWSPDGNKIAFDSLAREGWGIYVADVVERVPRKLVTNISSVVQPHWSRDGKWIYFSSGESARMGVYRCPASGGEAVLLSREVDGFGPRESFDGKTVYFASHDEKSTLKKVALPGQPGTESEVDGLPRLSGAGVWSLSPGGIYFVPADAPRSLRYFDFASKKIRPIFEADKDFGSGLSVSPDGRWIMYSLVSDETSDIMLVDHFH